MPRNRFLVKSFGDNADGTRAGLAKLIDLTATHNRCVIVFPNLSALKGNLLQIAFGEQYSAALIKNRKIVLDNGSCIEVCLHNTLKNFQRSDAYLALWGTKDVVEDIEALNSWTSFVLVTWGPQDSAQWEKDHDVHVIYDDSKR